MTDFEDRELMAQKALASAVIAELFPVSEKLTKQCEKQVSQIETIEKKLLEANDFGQIDTYSKHSNSKRTNFIRLLALRDRVNKIIHRNNDRIEYINNIFKNRGIYNEVTDKKELEKMEKENLENLSEQSVGIEGDSNLVKKYFAGTVFTFKAGALNFSIPENAEILKTADESLMHEIVSRFPESVSTIGPDVLVDYHVKRKILKEITAYVYDEAKRKNFREINKSLGGLLSFRKEIPENLETYIVGVQNMFNVLVKQYLRETYPLKIQEIEKYLKCNENSELIPEDRRPKKAEVKDENITLSATSDIEYGVNVNDDGGENSELDTDAFGEDNSAALELMSVLGIEIDDLKDTKK